MDLSTRWRLAPIASGLLHKDVEDGRLVFDPLSGRTQLLSPLGQFLMDQLARRPASVAALLRAALAEDGQGEDPATAGEQDSAKLQEALQTLSTAGFITAAPAAALA